MKHSTPLFLYAVLALLPAVGWPQCNGATSAAYLHGNHIRALIDPSGSLFWDRSDAQFIPQFQPPSAATIFAQGLWLGGTDAAGNIKMAAPTYGKSAGKFDYFPGPIIEDSNPTTDFCARWDKTWSVSRSAIEAHIADFNDNGIIDNPLPEILDWPALDNPHLAERLGLDLPDNRPMAPFFDSNHDGRYDPLGGDYPNVPQSDVLPDQIVWCVFNDAAAPHTDSPSPPLGVEVQLTAWAFMCTDNIDLNTTVFTSYKIINRSTETIEQFRVGNWMDFDLGCYEDDYLGSAPDQHTFFVYNENPFEQPTCFGGITPFAGDPPVQAVTFLNRPMASFLAYTTNSPGAGNGSLASYYNHLNGFYADGTPITPVGNGYNPGSGLPGVAFSFPGDPNVAEQWSAYSANIPSGDYRCVGATALGTLAPSGVVSVDLAYSYHRAAGASHIGNVQVMYDGVERIQAMYDSRFNNTCTSVPICDTDCVWAGDINNDGTANHCDLLPLALYRDLGGPIRLGPFNWQPRDGQPWAVATQYNGANMKHADANGSGVVEVQDFDYTIQHYGLTRPGYVAPADSYPAGDDITLLMFGVQTPVFQPDQIKNFRVRLDQLPANTVGLAFSLESDQRYGQISSVSVANVSGTYTYRSEVVAGQVDFARITLSEAELATSSSLFIFQFRSVADFSALPHPTTRLRIKNIKALLGDGTEVELGANELELTFDGVINAVEQPDWYADVAVFPNPASDEAHIQCPHPITDVQLFDLMGRSVPAPLRMNGTQATIITRALPAGVYAMQIHTAQGRGTWRMVVGE